MIPDPEKWMDVGWQDAYSAHHVTDPEMEADSRAFAEEHLTFTIEMQAVSPETLDLYFGKNPCAEVERNDIAPRHSVIADWTEEVSGEPAKPQFAKGFWHWLIGTNAMRQVAYQEERQQWLEAGKPTKTVLHRLYIPGAVISSGE